MNKDRMCKTLERILSRRYDKNIRVRIVNKRDINRL